MSTETAENQDLEAAWKIASDRLEKLGGTAKKKVEKQYLVNRKKFYKSNCFSRDLLHPADQLYQMLINPRKVVHPKSTREIMSALLLLVEPIETVPDYVPAIRFQYDGSLIRDLATRLGLLSNAA